MENLNFNITTELELNWDSLMTQESQKQVDNHTDALICSLKDKGKVDIEYMSEISNIPMDKLIEALEDNIYQDPSSWEGVWYKGFKTKDEYLSGDIFTKLQRAIEADEIYGGRFQKNIIALKSIMPKGISYEEIYYSISSSWIDKELIKDFITEVFKDTISRKHIEYVKETSSWVINEYVYFYNSANYTFGTSRIGTKQLLLKILNHREIAIYDTITVDGKDKKIFNKEETVLALEKAELLERAFKTYIAKNNLEGKIESCYNEKFRYAINRKYNGNFLNLPKLYDYQKNAVARILFNKNTLLAHNVGAGKTYVMVSAGEELLRLGYSTKNLYVVPNNIIGQWEDIYNELYPNNKLLVVYPKDFTPTNINDTLEKIKSDAYNAVITTFSVFDRIKHSKEVRVSQLKKEIEELTNAKVSNWIKEHNIKTKIKQLQKKLDIVEALDEDDEITFEELGVTRLFVDEAHNYKNISIASNRSYISGVSITGSKKCTNMMMAVDYLNKEGYGVIMATGTPITNSVTDIYVFQKYLQPNELRLLNIDTFDKWLSVFTEITEEIEVDVDTSKFRVKNRISKFYNIEDLTVILSNIADFCNPNNNKSIPVLKGYTDIVLETNPYFQKYLDDISVRVERIRKGIIDKKDDNLLKVTTDGRKAALDLRLVDESYMSLFENKVVRCASEVLSIYNNYPNTTQIIFCDYSTPKEGFNIYDELRNELIYLGIKKDEIEFIHNAKTEAKREKILANVRSGKIRVIIGSTSKLGTGVNVQDKLIAIHHLDVPWRPSDMMQREGRILREGNTNSEVFIYRYIQKNSFDAYSWQILERKAKIIRDILANTLTDKETDDIEDTVLSYAEIKALAVGNELLKEHIELCNKRDHIVALSKKQNERYEGLYNEIDVLNGKINQTHELIKKMRLDYDMFNKNRSEIIKTLPKYQSLKFDIKEYYDTKEEVLWFELCGFKVILPDRFVTKNRYILVKGNSVYKLNYRNLDDYSSDRLWNVISSIGYKINYQIESIKTMEYSKSVIDSELRNKIDFTPDINLLNAKIKKIEAQLDLR